MNIPKCSYGNDLVGGFLKIVVKTHTRWQHSVLLVIAVEELCLSLSLLTPSYTEALTANTTVFGDRAFRM